MSLILEWLVIGDAFDASNELALQKGKIATIINTTENIPNSFPNDYTYKNFYIEDTSTYDISKHFSEAIECLEYSKKSYEKDSKRCLVFCAAGVNQSVILVIAYLMKVNSWNLEKCYNFIKEKRSCINPASSWIGQLSIFEQKLFNGNVSKFGLEMRLFHYNENVPRIKFKCDVYNRSNFKMTDRLAKKTIKNVLNSYKEYFNEVILEVTECKTDEKENFGYLQRNRK
eukprot:gene916-9825_t